MIKGVVTNKRARKVIASAVDTKDSSAQNETKGSISDSEVPTAVSYETASSKAIPSGPTDRGGP